MRLTDSLARHGNTSGQNRRASSFASLPAHESELSSLLALLAVIPSLLHLWQWPLLVFLLHSSLLGRLSLLSSHSFSSLSSLQQLSKRQPLLLSSSLPLFLLALIL